MYLFINALLVALLLPTGAKHVADAAPTCRAQLQGLNLVTVVELPTGIAVEGPWRVKHQRDAAQGAVRLVATLDHVVEFDALTGDRSVIPFPQPVRLSFEGATQEDVVRRAARVWCVTVMRAQENRALDRMGDVNPTRIAVRAQPLVAA